MQKNDIYILAIDLKIKYLWGSYFFSLSLINFWNGENLAQNAEFSDIFTEMDESKFSQSDDKSFAI